jgi:hypothetical protein
MPKLQTLIVDQNFSLNCREESLPKWPRLEGEEIPKLKTIHSLDYAAPLVLYFSDSLVNLTIDSYFSEGELLEILINLSYLKSLKFYSVWKDTPITDYKPLNDSIESLEIDYLSETTTSQEWFRGLFISLPSLISLKIPKSASTEENLLFIGKESIK